MADDTQYLIFEGKADDGGTIAWTAVSAREASNPKQAIEAYVTEAVTKTQRPPRGIDSYAACPVRNWSAGPVTIESKPTVRAALSSGTAAAQVVLPQGTHVEQEDDLKGIADPVPSTGNGSAAGVDSRADATSAGV